MAGEVAVRSGADLGQPRLRHGIPKAGDRLEQVLLPLPAGCLARDRVLQAGDRMSAGKRKHGRTGDAGAYIKPMLVNAAWAAVKAPGRLQAKYHRLVRRFGGQKNPAAKKKAIIAIAHTLLKIAYQVLQSGQPYQDLGADFYTRRESPEQRQAYLLRQLQQLNPGCTITITPAEAA